MNDYANFYRQIAELERQAERGNRRQRRSGAAWERVQNIPVDEIVDEPMALERARRRASDVAQREQPYEGLGFFDPVVAAVRNTADATLDSVTPYEREGEARRIGDRVRYWDDAARGTGRFFAGVGDWINEHALDDQSVAGALDPTQSRERRDWALDTADRLAAETGNYVVPPDEMTIEGERPSRLGRLGTMADDMLWTGLANAREENTTSRVVADEMARYWRERGDEEKAQTWERAAQDSAAMHMLLTASGATEFIPGFGVVPGTVSAARGTARLGLEALGQEVPSALRAPIRNAPEREAAGPLTENARGWRNNFLLGGGAYLAADAVDGELGDDYTAPAIAAGGAMVLGRRFIPHIDSAIPEDIQHLARQGEIGPDGARNYTPNPRQRLTVDPEGRVAMDYEGSFNAGDGASVGEVRTLMRGAREAINDDIATTRRSEYSWTPNGESQARLYRNEFERNTPENYAFSETPQGEMRLRRLGAEFEPDPLPAQRVPDDEPFGFEGAPSQGRIIDAEATSAPQRRFEAAVRDPATGQVYRGEDHQQAIDSVADEAVRARLQAAYDAVDEDPSIIGFQVDGEFMGREQGMDALRARAGRSRQVRIGEQVNRDGSVTPRSEIDWDSPNTRLPADDEWFNNLAGMPTPPRMNIVPDGGIPGRSADDMLRNAPDAGQSGAGQPRIVRRTLDAPHAQGYGTGTFEILQNPTQSQLDAFMARELRTPVGQQWTREARGADPRQYYPLRFVRDADGNVYVSSGLAVEHDHMASGLRANGVNMGQGTRGAHGSGMMQRRDGQWVYERGSVSTGGDFAETREVYEPVDYYYGRRAPNAPDGGASGAGNRGDLFPGSAPGPVQVLEGEIIPPSRGGVSTTPSDGAVAGVVGALEPMIPEMRAAQADIRRVLGDEEYFAPRQPIDVDALEPNRRAIARASVALEEFVAQNRALRAEQAARALPDGGAAGGGNRVPAWEDAQSPVEAGLLTREQNSIYRDLSYHDNFTVEEVPLASLVRQHELDPTNRTGEWYQARGGGAAAAPSQLPLVARVNGRLLLMDGHHRALSEAGPNIRVRIYDVDRITNPPAGMRAVQDPQYGEWRVEPNRRAIARASVALEEFVAQNRALRAEQAARALPDGGASGAGNFDSRVVYRGMSRPYDPANGGYYQSFTSSLDDAREYGSQVMAANIRPGRNLAIDGGGNNFNALSVEQLPADVRARLHPSVGASATTDQIAHAAREAGYDSVTVRNVHDNRWGERPIASAQPRTIDFVFNTENIRPLDNVPPQAETATQAAEKVRLSAADRALLDELLDPDAPNAGPRRLGGDDTPAAATISAGGLGGYALGEMLDDEAQAADGSESDGAMLPILTAGGGAAALYAMRRGRLGEQFGDSVGMSGGRGARRLGGSGAPSTSPRLTDEQRAVLSPDQGYAVERRMAGLSNREIAEEMQTSASAVGVQLDRARRRLNGAGLGVEFPAIAQGRPADGITERVAELRAQGMDAAAIRERLGLTEEQYASRLQILSSRRNAAELPARSETADQLDGVNLSATEVGNAARTLPEPNEYTTLAYERVLAEAEELAAANGGKLPPGYMEQLAARTNYGRESINRIMMHERAGRFGPERAQRALAIQGRAGKESVNRDFIGPLMDRPEMARNPQAILERLNAYRAERGLEPTNISTVKSTMTQIRRARERRNEAIAALGVTGAGGALLFGDEAQAQGFDPNGQWIGEEQRRDVGDRTEIRQRFRDSQGRIFEGVRYQDHATGAISAPQLSPVGETPMPQLGDTYDSSEVPLRPEEIERIQAMRDADARRLGQAPERRENRAPDETQATTPSWALAAPLVAGVLGGRLGRRLGEEAGRPLMGETAGAMTFGGVVGGASGLATDAQDAGDLATFGTVLGAGGRGLYRLGEEGVRRGAEAVADFRPPAPRRVRGQPLPYVGDDAVAPMSQPGALRPPPARQPDRVSGSLDEGDLTREMSGRAIEEGRRRLRSTPVTMEERLNVPPGERGSLEGRLGTLGAEPLRELARREGLRTEGTVRDLARRLADAARADPARIQRYRDVFQALGVSGVIIGGASQLLPQDAQADDGASDLPDWADEAGIGAGAAGLALMGRTVLPRAIEGSVPRTARLGQMSRVSEIPMDVPTRPFDIERSRLGRMAPNSLDSDIDPRLVAGVSAAAAAPIGAGAAWLLNEYKPWEEQFGRESAYWRSAETRNEALRLNLRGVRAREVERENPELAAAMRELEAGGSDGAQRLEGRR